MKTEYISWVFVALLLVGSLAHTGYSIGAHFLPKPVGNDMLIIHASVTKTDSGITIKPIKWCDVNGCAKVDDNVTLLMDVDNQDKIKLGLLNELNTAYRLGLATEELTNKMKEIGAGK